VPKLLSLSKFGLGSLDDAIPNPKAGCIIKNGPAAVINPMMIAGRKLGLSSQPIPQTATSIKANVIPIK
jgi:hypothetical protein